MNKYLISLTILVILTAYVDTATFGITSVSTCTQQTTAGFCLRWQQNGSVTQTTSCFPATTQLYTLQNGIQTMRNMQDLRVGDMILSFDGSVRKYTQVIGWLHRKVQATGEYLQVKTNTGSLTVSASHNIALMDGTYKFASELLGEYLHNGQSVSSINTKIERGVYAPLTASGNYYVSMGNGQKTLAHCFANVRSPQFYEPMVYTIFKTWQFLYGKIQTEQIHPAANWMMDKFNFLVQA